MWWQLKRLRLAIEIDCDARVVARQHVHPARDTARARRAPATPRQHRRGPRSLWSEQVDARASRRRAPRPSPSLSDTIRRLRHRKRGTGSVQSSSSPHRRFDARHRRRSPRSRRQPRWSRLRACAAPAVGSRVRVTKSARRTGIAAAPRVAPTVPRSNRPSKYGCSSSHADHAERRRHRRLRPWRRFPAPTHGLRRRSCHAMPARRFGTASDSGARRWRSVRARRRNFRHVARAGDAPPPESSGIVRAVRPPGTPPSHAAGVQCARVRAPVECRLSDLIVNCMSRRRAALVNRHDRRARRATIILQWRYGSCRRRERNIRTSRGSPRALLLVATRRSLPNAQARAGALRRPRHGRAADRIKLSTNANPHDSSPAHQPAIVARSARMTNSETIVLASTGDRRWTRGRTSWRSAASIRPTTAKRGPVRGIGCGSCRKYRARYRRRRRSRRGRERGRDRSGGTSPRATTANRISSRTDGIGDIEPSLLKDMYLARFQAGEVSVNAISARIITLQGNRDEVRRTTRSTPSRSREPR